MEKLTLSVEALIFAADTPISKADIESSLNEAFSTFVSPEEVAEAIRALREKYNGDAYAMEIVEIAGGLQFMTKGAFHPVVGAWLRQTTKKRLSQAAVETLSILAYKQPVSKAELESIRGVSCDYTLQKLLERELVSIVGRSDGPGRPLLYGTSVRFMDYFGLNSLDDLPKPKDFKEPLQEIGERAPLEVQDGE
ncbi:MAG: hypothetical protein RLY31_2644 [Bacteroidota bacterium]|jgi:segregation and condensation protein B